MNHETKRLLRLMPNYGGARGVSPDVLARCVVAHLRQLLKVEVSGEGVDKNFHEGDPN